MKEFHINQFLSVRLQQDETIIYVAREPFRQCKFLLLNIPISEMSTFDEIESIDEAAEKMNEKAEREIQKIEIPPEVEFWGHCSNLQVWYEHGYDTRLIHSNLACPLLRKLTEVGDPLAKKVFKSEILKRYRDGSERTRGYLADEGFLEYITDDEQLNCLLDTDNFIALTELAEEVWPERDPYEVIFELYGDDRIKLDNRKVIELDFSGLELGLEKFPRAILDLKSLHILYFGYTYIKEIPEEIDNLKDLVDFDIWSNELSYLPESFCNLTSLERLDLGGNKIQALPKNIGNLAKLMELNLAHNQLKELPESMCCLHSLKKLILSYNQLMKIPKCIFDLSSLQILDVSGNPLLNNSAITEKLKTFKKI
jgi:hypothetical protein